MEHWLHQQKPEMVVIAAAKVGGIAANMAAPAEFLFDNLTIAANLIEGARQAGVRRLIYLGSSCIYPRLAPQPMTETALLTGSLEPSNAAYALAKLAGVKLCETYRRQHGCDFLAVLPANLYGPGDNFDPARGHVIPALMHRMADAVENNAPELTVWGSGRPLREFLHVDDLAAALLLLLQQDAGPGPFNVGSGEEISIADMAKMLAEITGFRGRLVFDPEMPDGTPRKLLDSSSMRDQGWQPQIPLRSGLEQTWIWYQQARVAGRLRGV